MTLVRTLMADDHAVVRAGIRKVVEEIPDLEVIDEVGDGPALFAALAQTRPDLLLIDLTMPNFDPIASIHQIRADYPGLKILVVSAYDDNLYVQGMLGAGANGYHLKDQPLSDLKLAIQRVLAGERWVSSPLISKLVERSSLPAAIPELTLRQRHILSLLRQGLDNQAIAQQTSLSVKTVENHLTRLYRQIQVQSRLEAANYVLQHPEVLGVTGQAARADSPVIETPAPNALTILVVDDNPRYRIQLQRSIGKVCPQAIIFEAGNVSDAARLSQRLLPRLVLVDVVLGDEDGIRCTRRIKTVSPGSRVVLISAYPDREFHRLGLEAGAIAFLDKKDLEAATLRQVIEDLIS